MTTVNVGARLHFGLLQTSDAYRRRYGGIGLLLKYPRWRLEAEEFDGRPCISGVADEVNRTSAEQLLHDWSDRSRRSARLSVHEAIPSHVGLGSKTSLLMGLSIALGKLVGGCGEATRLAHKSGRGRVSGIGSAALRNGGMILDVGVSAGADDTWSPSSAARWESRSKFASSFRFPQWEFHYLMPKGYRGLSGSREESFFREQLPTPARDTDALTALCLLQVIPAVLEADLQEFIQGITALQRHGLKRREWQIQPKVSAEAREFLEGRGFGVALSSLGPGFAVFGSDVEHVEKIVATKLGGDFDYFRTCAENQSLIDINGFADP